MKQVRVLLLFIFLGAGLHVLAEDFTLDAPPNISAARTASQTTQKKKGIKGFFNKLFYPKQKQRPQFDEDSKGYEGTLPDINSEFDYKRPKETKVKDKGEDADNYTPEEFQKSRTDDPLFLDVILNKDRPSQYNTDMLKVMRFLQSFRPVIEGHEPVQKFNANVNMLDLHTRRIERLYADKPEGMSPSYYKLLDLTYKAKVLGNLKFDANYYSQFSPVTGTAYAPENLVTEDNKLLIDLDNTIFEIQQLSN